MGEDVFGPLSAHFVVEPIFSPLTRECKFFPAYDEKALFHF
jgi:hypothetical protein